MTRPVKDCVEYLRIKPWFDIVAEMTYHHLLCLLYQLDCATQKIETYNYHSGQTTSLLQSFITVLTSPAKLPPNKIKQQQQESNDNTKQEHSTTIPSGLVLNINTGEGKSTITAALAAGLIILGRVVDVVSSSSVLARRDADNQTKFFELFDIECDCNDDPTNEYAGKNKPCYDADVVYGDIDRFKWDYLYHTFHRFQTKYTLNPAHSPDFLTKRVCRLDLGLKIRVMKEKSRKTLEAEDVVKELQKLIHMERPTDIVLLDECDHVLIDSCSDSAMISSKLPGARFHFTLSYMIPLSILHISH